MFFDGVCQENLAQLILFPVRAMCLVAVDTETICAIFVVFVTRKNVFFCGGRNLHNEEKIVFRGVFVNGKCRKSNLQELLCFQFLQCQS